MSASDWSIPGSADEPIIGNTHVPADPARGVLIISHGFKGYKDYGFMPCLARRAANAGFIAHRFNFSHSGMTDNISTFERPDLFEQDTWSKQVYDLTAVNAAVASGQLAGQGLPVIWFGHSRGGITTILTAARAFDDDDPNTPVGVIPAAAPHVACNLDDSMRQLLHQEGSLSSPSSRTGQDLRIGVASLDDIEADPDAVDPVQCIARIPCPILLIYGETDQTVGLQSAHALNDAAGENARLEVIDDAGHTFNCPNPLPSDDEAPPQTVQLADYVVQFAASVSV